MSQSSNAPGLYIGQRLDKNLYNQTGLLIARAGELLQNHHILMLKASGSTGIVQGTPKRKAQNPNIDLALINLEDVPMDEELKMDIHDENGRIMLRRGETLTRIDYDTFLRRGMAKVWVDRQAVDSGAAPKPREDKNSLLEMFDNENLNPDLIKVKPRGTPVRLRVNRRMRRSEQEKQDGVDLLKDTAKLSHKLVEELRHGKKIEAKPLRYMAQRGIDLICADLNFYGYLVASHNHFSDDWRSAHVAHTFITSLVIGIYMGYDDELMSELGVSALLHDIGMARVRPEILDKPGPLSKHEYMEVQAHPMLGVQIAEKIQGLEKHILLSVYQSHERVGGQGYPNKRTGAFIHDFAKIIAVADTFCAMRGHRPHRPPLSPYPSVERIVRLASSRKLDAKAVRGLLMTVGLYPMGSWVQLENGSIGRVVSMRHNAKRFDRPIIRVFYDKTEKLMEFPENIDLAANSQIKIAQALEPSYYQTEPTMGF